MAWDTRAEEQGGQRWFHVYGDQGISHSDSLHWTGREQNWNYMCAECHSTKLEKNYDPDSDTFDTTWSEINVACEACHGPGSQHAQDPVVPLVVDLDDTGASLWQMNPETGIAERSEALNGLQVQPEACGRCHSRRGLITTQYEYGLPLADTHLPSLLEDGLYFADGQIRDEVYVYGSFLQSRMYQAGVTCSDCHDSHSGSLKTKGQVSDVCAACHLASKYASGEHHHHADADVACVDCHMPARTYMGVDPRRDHSFRVPSPALTIKTGSPNACTNCHSGRSDEWAAQAVEAWYGGSGDEQIHFAEAIHAGRSGDPSANSKLIGVIDDESEAGIVRATALSLLAPPFSDAVAAVIRDQIPASDPLIRIAALRALEGISPEYRGQWAAPLLGDPVRAVRIQAANTLSLARASLRQADQERFRAAEQEYIDAQLAIAERPEADINLGNLYAERGDVLEAEQSYLLALRKEPQAVAARVNLADLYRQLRRDGDAERALREGLVLDGGSAALHHALGLTLVRSGQAEDALEALGRAAGLNAANARYVYVYAVALNSLDESDRAIGVLENARAQFPGNYDIAWALATMYRDVGRTDEARAVAERLLEQIPNDRNARALLDAL
jgi:tetratricopeptide (TPR) repeat protein